MGRTIGHERERDTGFYDWIPTQPEWCCIVTGVEDTEQHSVVRCHIRSRGAGGSDRWIMPLVVREHAKADTYPAWWYTHRVAVCEWVLVLRDMWERYDTEQAERMTRS